jgi:hypothetical protein
VAGRGAGALLWALRRAGWFGAGAAARPFFAGDGRFTAALTSTAPQFAHFVAPFGFGRPQLGHLIVSAMSRALSSLLLG